MEHVSLYNRITFRITDRPRIREYVMPEPSSPRIKGVAGVKEFVSSDVLEFITWLSRLFTMIFAVIYLIPIIG